jgi:hypothetical protein
MELIMPCIEQITVGEIVQILNVDVGLDDDRVCLSFAVNFNRRLHGYVTHNCIPETYELPIGDV